MKRRKLHYDLAPWDQAVHDQEKDFALVQSAIREAQKGPYKLKPLDEGPGVP